MKPAREARRVRQTRWRQRRHDGIAIAPVPFNRLIVDALEDRNLLRPADA